MRLDTDTGAVVPWVAVGVPPCAVEDHQEFTSGFLRAGELWGGTRSSVVRLDLASRRLVQQWSHPLLYDVHSVLPGSEGTLWVTATGHDSVLRFSETGALLEHHWLRDESFNEAYSGISDFRTVRFDHFKPHHFHVNRAFELDGVPWVTLFEARRAQRLDGSARIELPEGPPHDGIVREGALWFTTVEGTVVALDPLTKRRLLTLHLSDLDSTPGLAGWCRGIEVVGRRVFVGMTALRSTTHREVLRRVLRGAAGIKRPSRVVEIDLDGPKIVGSWPIFGEEGGGTIFGIFAAERGDRL